MPASLTMGNYIICRAQFKPGTIIRFVIPSMTRQEDHIKLKASLGYLERP